MTNLPIVVAGGIVGVYGIAKDVTERKRAEEVRSRLATIVESSEDAIVSRAADGTIISWNGGAENLYGYAAEEVVGRSNAFLYPPEHPCEMAEILEKSRRGEAIRQYETVRMAKDGRRVDVSLTVSPIMDASGNVVGDSGIARDITERKRAESELRAVYRRHRETIDSAEAIIWRGDARTLRFTFVSHQAEAILGYPAARWIAEPTFWTEHMHPDDREWALAFCEAAAAEKRAHTFEYRMVAADGRVVWLRESVHVVVKDEVPTELVGVMTDVTERRALEKQLRHQALHDPLTGLPNRTLLLDRLTHALERADRRGRCVAVLFLDLDDFKVVNDSLGHEAGDRMLVGAAERLTTCLRPGDTLARLGGDEYVALLEDVRGREEAPGSQQGWRRRCGNPSRSGREEEVFVSASIGVALGSAGEDRHGGSSDDLLRRADMAMYEAKRKGKAHHEVFEQRMDVPALERLRMGTDLRRAIERGEFRVYYQPEVSLRTGRIVGFEALVRWEHPEQGLVSPARFVPVAEETGMIVQMGRWILEEACRQAKAWHDPQPGGLPLVMSVNLSARQFGHPDLVRDVAQALGKSGLAPNSLVLEITESVVMDDVRYTVDTLGELKALGVGLAVDDFGTGYSSLSYLKRFPVDFLKVDRSFVDGLGEDPEDVVLVSGIVDLAHALGLKVVGEGVETEYQFGLLRAMGCDLAQGYHFARPMPGEEATAFLAARHDLG
ncbi:MAG: EAL domain-containing protein [Actinomycetota bacterium]|nr:EAL domain-containing protein [Actinomycetota bacterium]